jgi:hypothetical protein
MVLLFWIAYNRFSRHLMQLHEILPQVMIRKPLILLLRVSRLMTEAARQRATKRKMKIWHISKSLGK